MTSPSVSGRVVAVLGPTNTGKTHLALERMLGHASGMIGFPLRLLARENYDKIVRLKGKAAVALLTGEEKIIPAHPSWFVCTVESMPLDRRVAFLAIDEIQLAADPDRGHIFTDRLLHARGMLETMFLGAETIKPLIRRLVPDVEFVSRPRFSQLTYTGPQKLTRLPPRSAVVAFSATDVYALAELMRRQKGGAAVVLGALSPRTRNAQVALYQAGEVDYLVATDAIGMGLNMDVDHVAFAALRKFDGRAPRPLEAAEVAQIAGRAGRHMNNGTFGTTGDIGAIDPDIVAAVEGHSFPPLKYLQWRNSDLRFTSIEALLASLRRLPDTKGLMRAPDACDQLVLQALAADPDIVERSRAVSRLRLLWEVCQIPDFRKTLPEQHSRLAGAIFRHLTQGNQTLPPDWLNAQIERLERVDGDIDTLIARIANVRTWTYVSHRGDWLDDAPAWQERTRAIEDRLSDALHDRLTLRFVDRRTTLLTRKLKESAVLQSTIETDGKVEVEGQFVGNLRGFQFRADRGESLTATRAVAAAAQRALRPEIASRVIAAANDDDDAFSLASDGSLLWQEAPIAMLTAGATRLTPMVDILPSDLIEGAARARLGRRLSLWLEDYLAGAFASLHRVLAEAPAGAGRGLAFQLGEGLGSMACRPATGQLRALTESDRKNLARLGVRLGVESVYLPVLLKPAAQRLRALLWAVHRNGMPFPPLPPAGRVAIATPQDMPEDFPEAIGFRRFDGIAVRVDILERFAFEARQAARLGAFALTPPLSTMLGLGSSEAAAVLKSLGYQEDDAGQGIVFSSRRQKTRRPRRPANAPDPHSPFAVLRGMGRG